jgi:hypothetical protein
VAESTISVDGGTTQTAPARRAKQMSLTMTPRNQRSIKSCILLAAATSGSLCLALWAPATSAQSDASTAPKGDELSSEHQRFHDRDHSTPPRRTVDRRAERRLVVCSYQLGNLKGAFDRLGRAYPMEHETPLQEMISSVIAQPFEDTRKAIETKDSTAFSRAYGDLTSALQLRPSGHKPWRGRNSGANRLINLRPGL